MSLLDLEQSEGVTISDLEKLILRQIKKILVRDAKRKDSNPRHEVVETILLPVLMAGIGPMKKNGDASNRTFKLKFYEAIARLKRRGLLMDVVGTSEYSDRHGVYLTSVGERSVFDDGVLTLIDDAQEVVNTIKEAIPNLDDVVEQYFLESLRTCQEGCYIASVICLGAASERAIRCLADVVINRDDRYQKDIENQRSIFALTNYLSDKILEILKPIENSNNTSTYRNELKEKLNGIAWIYRRNRNEAGHPLNVSQDWTRDEQECYLNQFRRYVCAVFKAIDILENGQQNEAEQS